MADPLPSLFDDPVEEPSRDQAQPPDQLDSLIHRLTSPVKKENTISKPDLEENDYSGVPETQEFHDSVPDIEEFHDSMPLTEELNGSAPMIGENNDSLPMVEEKNGSFPVVEKNDTLPTIDENNDGKPELGENNTLRPVLPGESGEGLPYAPENWPNPGDNWKWRVGHRYNAAGYFVDRFLYLPQHLRRTPASKQMFASKPALEKFIGSEFPDADVNAFFASFTWKVPVKTQFSMAVAAALPHEDNPMNGVEEANAAEKQNPPSQSKRKTPREKRQRVATQESSTPPLSQREKRPRAAAPLSFKPKKEERIVEETPRSSSRKREAPQSSMHEKETAQSSTQKREGRRSSRLSTLSTPIDKGNQEQPVPEEPAIEVPPIPPDFDNYLKSLEDILTQPLSVTLPSYSKPTDALAIEDEMNEARNKLSSLLLMDFPTLVSSNYYPELVSLATKLRQDPRLTAEQLVKLKLIEEIPLFSEVFLESREIIDQVDRFFTNLEGNKSKVSSLKNEFNELKEKADQLQAQLDSNVAAVQEIDNQIAQLQAWRAELVGKIESNESAKAEVTHTQKMVANGIPPLVQEVQVANAKIPDWELRRSNAESRVGEILAKFAPLQGFSL